MYNPYGFHSMSKLYRGEALRDAQTRHLEGRLRAEPRRVQSGRAERICPGGVVSLLLGASLTGQTAGRSEERR